MHTTPPSLLQKLREPQPTSAWHQFVDLYTPLLFTWAHRLGLQAADAADLVQEVFVALVQLLPQFQYDPVKRNFRGWLRTLCHNKWRDRQRLRSTHLPTADEVELAALPAADEWERFWDQEHQAHLLRQALAGFEGLKDEFAPQTLEVCREVVLKDRPVAEVAEQFGLTANAVYIAKLRVLRRLREELKEFLE